MRNLKPVVCLALALAAVPLWAGDATVTDDTYTSQAKPATPMGGLPQILVDSADHAYIKFDLSTLPAGTPGSQVARATLLLWVNRVVAAGMIDVLPVTGAWDENSLTWNSEAAAGAPLAQPVTIAAANQYLRVDVTSLVQGWLNGSANQGIKLQVNGAAPGTSVFFDSKESTGTSHAAIIDIVLSGPAGTTGAVGATGATGAAGATGATGPAGPNVLAAGTAAGPSLAFQSSPSTGIYSKATDSFDIATGGIRRFEVRPDGDLDMTGGLRRGGSPFLWMPEGTSTGVGQSTLAANTTGGSNTAFGQFSMFRNTTGSFNTALGQRAIFSNVDGSQNTAVGYHALTLATNGNSNTAIGYQALGGLTGGSNNLAIGGSALGAVGNGVRNIAIGDSAGSNVSGTDNILIGVGTGFNLSGTETSNLYIANAGVAGESGTLRIGAAGTYQKAFVAGIRGVTTGASDAVPVVIDSNGQLGTVSSSRRFKEEIVDMGDASNSLMRLRPVTYRYKQPYTDGSRPIQYGLIAEEVAEVYPDLVARNQAGQIETVQYYKLDAMLLNEIQKQQHLIEKQQNLLEDMAARLAALEAQNR